MQMTVCLENICVELERSAVVSNMLKMEMKVLSLLYFFF